LTHLLRCVLNRLRAKKIFSSGVTGGGVFARVN
jgi:hypothetical protein